MTSFASARMLTNADMGREYIAALMSAYVPSAYPDEQFRMILGQPAERAADHGYSSCGDLIHFAMWAAGVRDTRILNRDPWHTQINISRLISGAKTLGVYDHYTGQDLQTGDCYFIGGMGSGTAEHVGIFNEHDVTDPSGWDTWDAGQVDSFGRQCAKAYPYIDDAGVIHKRTLSKSGGAWRLGGRPINGIVRLYDVPVEADILPVDNGGFPVLPIIGTGIALGLGAALWEYLKRA